MAPNTTPFVLYDIAFASPYTTNTGAPNPWKARYALNFKSVPYRTEWVQMPDITTVRKSLGVPACRKFADGTDFYTLPVLVTDPATNAAIGDSFDIAVFLEEKFPGAGAGNLFPEQKLDYELPSAFQSLVPLSETNEAKHKNYVKFQANVDMAFTVHTMLTAHGMKWDEDVADKVKEEFLKRVGKKNWDEMGVYGEERVKLMESLKGTIKELAGMLERDGEGPFLMGKQPSYADILIGAWLRMFNKTLPREEWDQLEGWYGGVFGKLHWALQERFGRVE